ncbi:hypothetical protein JZ751_017759 [Albula glossodonta]|uniref:Butyrophilin subfamily 1 member A1-like n=1 Tax=Albula glossodonta TaxID=121402 RepID=A0A8T2PPA7_9TELE|nr:hypothetical protein JZ751_017759 [Albula glossodonta]
MYIMLLKLLTARDEPILSYNHHKPPQINMKPCFAEFLHFLLLLAFEKFTAGQTVETVPPSLQPIVGVWNHSMTLPCHIRPPQSAVGLHVRWFRQRFDRPLHLYRYGHDDTALQDPAYQGRTQLFQEELRNGNVSLSLTDLHPSDSGVYHCFVEGDSWNDQWNVHLLIPVTGSQPTVSIDTTGNPKLVCRSEGWFPEPKVTWWDKRGVAVTPHTTWEQDSQGLLSVTSVIDIQKKSNVFSCMVTAGGESQQSKLHITEDFYPLVSLWKVLFILMLSLPCISIPVLFRAWRKLNEKYQYICNAVPIRLEKELAALRQPIKSEWGSICACAATVTLDPDTAYCRLVLTANGKEVYLGEKWLHLPEDAGRFKQYPYILGKEGYCSGRHYWEVEVGSKRWWYVGVCRESVNRDGEMDTIPSKGYWTMELRDEETYRVGGNSLSLREKPHRVGVYLDYENGQLSFYNAKSTSHIHTLNDHFTETLYPFFYTGVIGGDIPLTICPIEH